LSANKNSCQLKSNLKRLSSERRIGDHTFELIRRRVLAGRSPRRLTVCAPGALGPVETLAQSVSAMAPSTSPSLTIPLVFALAGNATWFVYLMATGATLLVGFCVSRFARLSASPGSLYSYTARAHCRRSLESRLRGRLLLAYLAPAHPSPGARFITREPVAAVLPWIHWTPPALPLLHVCAAWQDGSLIATSSSPQS
jgi:hypothetical protein